jgi:hypothetical protein
MSMASDVEQAQKILDSLMDQRDELVSRANRANADRQNLSFSALTSRDKQSMEKLRKANDQAITFNVELENLDSAIRTATQNLDIAHRAEALASDRASAEALREKLSRFTELALNLDDRLTDFLSTAKEMDETLAEMRKLGAANPSDAQMRVLATFCLKAFVMAVPWCAREWEHLAPGQRKSFRDLALGWHTMIEAGINARLGLEPEPAKPEQVETAA